MDSVLRLDVKLHIFKGAQSDLWRKSGAGHRLIDIKNLRTRARAYLGIWGQLFDENFLRSEALLQNYNYDIQFIQYIQYAVHR